MRKIIQKISLISTVYTLLSHKIKHLRLGMGLHSFLVSTNNAQWNSTLLSLRPMLILPFLVSKTQVTRQMHKSIACNNICSKQNTYMGMLLLCPCYGTHLNSSERITCIYDDKEHHNLKGNDDDEKP